MVERIVTDIKERKLIELGIMWQTHHEAYIKATLTDEQDSLFGKFFLEVDELRIGNHKVVEVLFENTKPDLRQDLLNLWADNLTQEGLAESLEELVEVSRFLMEMQYKYHLQNPFESGLSD